MEYYVVISGRGTVRHAEGVASIETGDAFIFASEEPHQLMDDSAEDLLVLVVSDHPIGGSCHYPDSGKWLVRSPQCRSIRSERLE